MNTVYAEAFGRLQLLGESSLANGGRLLSTSSSHKLTLQIKRRTDQLVRVCDQRAPQGTAWTDFHLSNVQYSGGWVDFVPKVLEVLSLEGRELSGFEVLVDSAVPSGSGLALHAVCRIALLRGLNKIFELDLSDQELARVAHRSDAERVGSLEALIDYYQVSFGRPEEALCFDPGDISVTRLTLPKGYVDFAIVKLKSATLGMEKVARSHLLQEALQALSHLGIQTLSEIGIADLPTLSRELPTNLFRRVRHVVSENVRVQQALSRIREAKYRALGQLINESQVSLRDDMGLSTPLIDQFVALALAENGVDGVRLVASEADIAVFMMTRGYKALRVAERVVERFRGIHSESQLSTIQA